MKNNLNKLLETIGGLVVLSFGLYVLYFGFRMIGYLFYMLFTK